MSDSVRNESLRGIRCGDAETTLRLIASLPAPEGLEERVRAGLRAAPRKPRLLAWPEASPAGGWMARGWMRSAAAAAIVCVVAGGGWGIYARVQPAQTARGVVSPHVGPQGGFSEGAAVRRPQTLSGPAVTHPLNSIVLQPAVAAKAAVKPATKNRGARTKMVSKAAAPAPSAVE